MCMGAIAAYQNSKMQEYQAEYMADLEAENARLATRQGEAIDLQGNQERLQLYNSMKQARGTARTSYAAGGVVLGSGSSADYEADIADAYDLDSRNLNYDIASRKWQAQVQAANATNQASLYKAQASSYRATRAVSVLNGAFGDLGTTLSTAASVITLLA